MEEFQALLDVLKDPETPFGVMDPVYSIYLLYGLVRGIFRGLPEELASLGGTALVIVGAHFFYQPVSELMIANTQLESKEASLALAYLLMILLFFIAWRLITLVIKKALDWTCPRPLTRPGGALLGLSKCILILSILLTAVQLSGHQFLKEHLISRSWIGRGLREVIPAQVHEVLPDWVPELEETDSPESEAESTDHGSGNA